MQRHVKQHVGIEVDVKKIKEWKYAEYYYQFTKKSNNDFETFI